MAATHGKSGRRSNAIHKGTVVFEKPEALPDSNPDASQAPDFPGNTDNLDGQDAGEVPPSQVSYHIALSLVHNAAPPEEAGTYLQAQAVTTAQETLHSPDPLSHQRKFTDSPDVQQTMDNGKLDHGRLDRCLPCEEQQFCHLHFDTRNGAWLTDEDNREPCCSSIDRTIAWADLGDGASPANLNQAEYNPPQLMAWLSETSNDKQPFSEWMEKKRWE